MKYGIWVEAPGSWTGWLCVAFGETAYPLTFCEEEARERADRARSLYPAGSLVEARPNPPETFPWNETKWRRMTA